ALVAPTADTTSAHEPWTSRGRPHFFPIILGLLWRDLVGITRSFMIAPPSLRPLHIAARDPSCFDCVTFIATEHLSWPAGRSPPPSQNLPPSQKPPPKQSLRENRRQRHSRNPQANQRHREKSYL